MVDRGSSTGRARLRVAIVAPSAYLLGGVQTWLDYLVPGLESKGWDVTVVLVHGIHSNAHRYIEQHPFRQVQFVSNFTGSHEGRVRALAKAVRSIRPGLVLGVNIVDVYEAVARVRSEEKGDMKVAIALHGLQPCFYSDLRKFQRIVDGVIATNRLGAAAAVELAGIPVSRVCYAPCGVDVPVLSSPDMGDHGLSLLYSGRFDQDEKRVMDLPLILEALDRRRIAYRLRLAGSGPAEIELRKALVKFGDRVEFMGVLSETDLRASFYTRGAVLLIMSPSETGPLVAWEAMANGVALVTSRFAGIGLEGSLRDSENCLIFPVGDAELAADAISKLVDAGRREGLIQAGNQSVRGRYSRDASVKAWDRAMRKILTMSPRTCTADLGVTSHAAAGRLDRLLGTGNAETLRRLLRIRFQHSSAGAEWPHSYSSNSSRSFHLKLAAMDQSLNPDLSQ